MKGVLFLLKQAVRCGYSRAAKIRTFLFASAKSSILRMQHLGESYSIPVVFMTTARQNKSQLQFPFLENRAAICVFCLRLALVHNPETANIRQKNARCKKTGKKFAEVFASRIGNGIKNLLKLRFSDEKSLFWAKLNYLADKKNRHSAVFLSL